MPKLGSVGVIVFIPTDPVLNAILDVWALDAAITSIDCGACDVAVVGIMGAEAIKV